MRYWAARELGKAKGADAATAVPALTEGLADPDGMVRTGAAYAHGDLGPDAKSSLPALQKAGKDASPEFRDAVAYAVKKIKGGK
jgi:HEAT repeat protein